MANPNVAPIAPKSTFFAYFAFFAVHRDRHELGAECDHNEINPEHYLELAKWGL